MFHGHIIHIRSHFGLNLNPTELASMSMKQETEENCLCRKCKLEHPKDDMIVKRSGSWESEGQVDQIICKPCNRAIQRIATLKKTNDELEGVSEVLGDDRADMMQQAHDLFGSNLAKRVKDCISRVRSRTATKNFKVTDHFMDEIDVKDKFKNKPQQLASILDTPKDECQWCPRRKVYMYPVPEYEAKDETEDRLELKGQCDVLLEEGVKKVPKPEGKAAIKQGEGKGEAQALVTH